MIMMIVMMMHVVMMIDNDIMDPYSSLHIMHIDS